MVTADDVRSVGLSLPRSYEQFIGKRFKLKVRQLVYVAFSRDETAMGFAFPREERDSLVASDPESYFLPRASDLRYHWVCAHLDRLDETLMRELITDGWRMCVPAMLHELPELAAPAMQAWGALDAGDLTAARSLIHPRIEVSLGRETIHGRPALLDRVRERGTPKPPTTVEVRDGQVYRWRR